MLTIKEVKTARDIKAFIELPLQMYKNCPYFVPPLYGDEKKLLKSGGCSETAESGKLLIISPEKPRSLKQNETDRPDLAFFSQSYAA